MFVKISFLCLYLYNFSFAADEEPIVSLPDGLIKGKLTETAVVNNNRTFYSFLGVRYAQPPHGKARFLAPVDLQPWNGTFDATFEKHKCYQVNVENELQSEDCLFLNIFTPELPDENFTTLLPVLFFIHGGGFVSGSGLVVEGFSGDFFMDYGVLLVSINYRLGPFGFSSTGDDVIPGNSGLKDQNMALKWVNKNIKYFGEDPNKVTIVGHSAGSASVSYHLLSKQSTGLFQAAILQSGSALSPWAFQRNQTNITYSTAALVNTTYDVSGISSSKLLDYLVANDGDAIHHASGQMSSGELSDTLQIQQGYFYAPVFEPEGDDAFLTKSMYDLYESGEFNQVPVLMGITGEESLYLYTYYGNFPLTQETFDEDLKLAVPRDMHIINEEDQTVVGKLIRDKYAGVNSTWSDNLIGSIQYFSDQCFTRSIRKQAELQSNYSDVYFYQFSYEGVMGLNTKPRVTGVINVGHGQELAYLFPRGSNELNTANLTQFSAEDVKVHYRMMSVWTNFAKFSNPTPSIDDVITVTWPKVDLTNGGYFKYMDINEDLTIQINPRDEKYQFWKEAYDQNAIPPYDTY